MKRTIFLILIVISLMLPAIAFLSGAREQEPETPSLERVREELTALRTLRSSEYRYREVVYFSERGRVLGIPAGRREVLFSIDIVVQAGVDLMRGFEIELDEREQGTLFLSLPGAEILRVDADERSIDQYFSQERLGRLDWLDVGEELARAKERNREDAISRGILIAAEEQARGVLRNLLRSTGYDRVEIRFRPVTTELRG